VAPIGLIDWGIICKEYILQLPLGKVGPDAMGRLGKRERRVHLHNPDVAQHCHTIG
jgi:hypothetical protein